MRAAKSRDCRMSANQQQSTSQSMSTIGARAVGRWPSVRLSAQADALLQGEIFVRAS